MTHSENPTDSVPPETQPASGGEGDGMAPVSAVAASDLKTIPYEITTDRLVARCWEEHDAAVLKEAIDSSLEHLRSWMAWARHEPEPVEKKRERIVQWRERFLREHREFAFGIFTRADGRLVGSAAIKFRDSREIAYAGYWLRASEVGNGYATEAIAALTLASFHVIGVRVVEVFCHPRNDRSAAVPRRLGFRKLEGEHDRRLTTGENRPSQIWQLRVHELHGTPFATQCVMVRNTLREMVWYQ